VITTSASFEHFSDDDELWLSDLETRAIDLENEISVWREARQRALAEDIESDEPVPNAPPAAFRRVPDQPDFTRRRATAGATDTPTRRGGRSQQPGSTGRRHPADERTKALIDRGRRTAGRIRLSRSSKIAVGIALLVVLIILLAKVVFRPGASWPPSVATVQSEITTACQNPDVASEPDQVNFACGKDTSQILWVFSLMTSADNANFADAKSGRRGLEPITVTEGGEVAWSLNLHHPYNPYNPIDSLEVAARAINNIIGGATLTGTNGTPTVQSGLESNPTNCARYTGSAAVITRQGYPDICASQIAGAAGQAALVADVYEQWMLGSAPTVAQEASVLFQNANNPGNPQVQAILKSLSLSA
jgi:hypothetical protein